MSFRLGLEIIQQPERARACGFGDKINRRPIDPPIVLQLTQIFNEIPETRQEAIDSDNPGTPGFNEYKLVVMATLFSEDCQRNLKYASNPNSLLDRIKEGLDSMKSSSTSYNSQYVGSTSRVLHSSSKRKKPAMGPETAETMKTTPTTTTMNTHKRCTRSSTSNSSSRSSSLAPTTTDQLEDGHHMNTGGGGSSQSVTTSSSQSINASVSSSLSDLPIKEGGGSIGDYNNNITASSITTVTTSSSFHSQHHHSQQQQPDLIPTLFGSVVSQSFNLVNLDNKNRMFFIFPQLCIRPEGRYKIKFTLHNLSSIMSQFTGEWVGDGDGRNNNNSSSSLSPSGALFSVFTETFSSHSSRDFPGMAASSALTLHLAAQGITIPIRKKARKKRGKAARLLSQQEEAVAGARSSDLASITHPSRYPGSS